MIYQIPLENQTVRSDFLLSTVGILLVSVFAIHAYQTSAPDSEHNAGLMLVHQTTLIQHAFANETRVDDMHNLANPCFDIVSRECSPDEKITQFYQYKGSEWMEQKKAEMIAALNYGDFHAWIDETDDNSHFNVYQYYSMTEDMTKLHIHQPPYKQINQGRAPSTVLCNDPLMLILKQNGFPACVTSDTKVNLIRIGWMKTQFNVFNETSFIEATQGLDEVQLFLSMHPDAKVNVDKEWFRVEYEKSGFREHLSSQIIQHTKRLLVGLDYEGKPYAHLLVCGGPVSLETSNATFLEDKDWCFPHDQSKFDLPDEHTNTQDMTDCNNMNGKYEAQCFKDSFESCTPAITHSIIYTIEGDPMYLVGVITNDCKIHVTFDNSEDRFGGSGKGISTHVCSGVELHEEYIWVINECDKSNWPEFQINYEAQEWSSYQRCASLGGSWSYEFHNCVGVFDKNQCIKAGGTPSCMSHEQKGHGRDVCMLVCEIEPEDRK